LKLTLKDGGENDADGNHANGVVESTISIATPVVVGGNDDSNDNGDSSSGGGCVYNPNAPARLDIVFILLMILSAYYLIRRRRRFSH
ncbi:JDVT-CTERM domain-containing protein, partial [Bathymodiolus thermophilus thioautotrophic gill symbiont]